MALISQFCQSCIPTAIREMTHLASPFPQPMSSRRAGVRLACLWLNFQIHRGRA
jgi:hypothetical protein